MSTTEQNDRLYWVQCEADHMLEEDLIPPKRRQIKELKRQLADAQATVERQKTQLVEDAHQQDKVERWLIDDLFTLRKRLGGDVVVTEDRVFVGRLRDGTVTSTGSGHPLVVDTSVVATKVFYDRVDG